MLANPMTYGDPTTPTSPPTSYPQPSRVVSNPNTPTNSHHGFVRSMERWSLKSKSKNQSFFKIFNRSSSGGASNSVVRKEEEDMASSGSEPEDPFSVSQC